MSIPLSTIKAALKIDYSDDDADLIRLREAAWSLVERETGLALTPAVRTQYLARWADTCIAFHPFTSVASVQYRDGSNVLTTMPSADWWIDRSEGALPIIRFLESPSIYEGSNIEVNVTCGYSAIPNELVHAMIAIVGGWYSNPEAFQPIGLSVVPMSVQYILESHRVRSFIR